MKTRIDVNMKAGEIDITIYDVIGDGFFGGTSPREIMDALRKTPDARRINVFINSPGGSVFDAATIYNMLHQHKAHVTVHVDGLAASAASLVAMAGDDIIMAENAMMMIHDPWTITMGSAADIRKDADMLEKIEGTLVATYAARTGKTQKSIAAMMEAETWMTADEAVDMGFATEVVAAKRAAAFVSGASILFRHTPPQAVLDQFAAGETIWTKAAAMLGLKASPAGQPQREESEMTTATDAIPAAAAAPGLTAEQLAEHQKAIEAAVEAEGKRRDGIAAAIGDFPEVLAAAQADRSVGVTDAMAMALPAAKARIEALNAELAASQALVKAAAEAGLKEPVDTGDEEGEADFEAELQAMVKGGKTLDAAMVAMARKHYGTAAYDEWLAAKQTEIPSAKSQQ